jgi:hypothetical protein
LKLSDICIGIDKMCKFKHWKTGLSELQTTAKMFFYCFKVGISGRFPFFCPLLLGPQIQDILIFFTLLLCRTLTTKLICVQLKLLSQLYHSVIRNTSAILCNSWFKISLSSSYLHQWKQCTIRPNL